MSLSPYVKEKQLRNTRIRQKSRPHIVFSQELPLMAKGPPPLIHYQLTPVLLSRRRRLDSPPSTCGRGAGGEGASANPGCGTHFHSLPCKRATTEPRGVAKQRALG